MDGARLTPKDQKAVIDKLLAHHPHSDDKIGCGLDSIMVSFFYAADWDAGSIVYLNLISFIYASSACAKLAFV